MHNRFKRLMKALLDGDINTAKVEAENAKRSIEKERLPHEEAIIGLNEQEAWLEMTLKLNLPDPSTATNSKPTTYKSPKEVGDDGYTKRQRGDFLRNTALSFVRQGRTEFSIQEILSDLGSRGIVFSIKRPEAAVASTLRVMGIFDRTETGNFKYNGMPIESEALPLMESEEAH